MIGAGGMAANWIRQILPSFRDRLEIVGLVDVSLAALEAAGDFLELDQARRFTDMRTAFDAVDADLCVVVVPARFHAEAFARAAEHGVPILCEKPLADTWADCRAIYRAVREADVRMQVVQNYRYYEPTRTLKAVLESGDLGRVNYIVARFADDCRDYDTWRRRHELPHAMLMDGAAHHFDMLRNLSGADCARITALEWNPPWSSSKGEFCALCVMHMSNDTRATYEGSATAAGEQNPWRQESYRVECEDGAVSVGLDKIVRIHRHRRGPGLVTEEVPAVALPREGHGWIVAEFLDWLDGGPAPATRLDDNMRSAAMIFGAIESARTGQTVDVQGMVEEAVSS